MRFQRFRQWWQGTKTPQTRLDAWGLIGQSAMYGGMAMMFGLVMVLAGTRILDITPAHSLGIQAIPYLIGAVSIVLGIFWCRHNYADMERKGYLDALLNQAKKREKR